LGIWVKNGSRNETPDNNGISHFIEHMLFKGTEKFSTKDIANIFDAIGGNVNAYTAKEYTCYYAKVLDEHLAVAAEVLADMIFHSVFDEEELKKEKNVIIEEIAMYEDAPDDMVHDLIYEAAFGEHSLAYPIIGTEKNLQRMDAEELKAYMRRNYFVENTVISIAGNVDERIIDLLEKHFGSFSNHGNQDAVSNPHFVGGQKFHHKQTEQNHICLAFPGCALDDDRLFAMTVLNNVIGGGMSSRLFQEIREKKGLAYSVYSYHSAYRDSGLLNIYIGTAPKQSGEVLNITLEELGKIMANGISEDELKRAKEQLKGSLILSLESTNSRMNRNGKNELMLGKHYTLDETIDLIDRVTNDEIKELTNRFRSVSFALALVGESERALSAVRRDQFVLSSEH
jgi:predicted Zn-dependent peptidase